MSGNSCVVSFSGNDVTTGSCDNITEGTLTHDPSNAYHEFWHPLEFQPIADPADVVSVPSNWQLYSTEDQNVVKALDELREMVEDLAAKVEKLTGEHAEATETDPKKRELTIELDEEDHDDIVASLDDLIDAMRADSENSDGDQTFEINPDVLREAVQAEAAEAIMKRTGKLPKEV